MRRFLLHVLPSGFHRIRHYGLLANPERKNNLAQARTLLEAAPAIPAPPPLPVTPAAVAPPAFVCPGCGAAMRIIDTFVRKPRSAHHRLACASLEHRYRSPSPCVCSGEPGADSGHLSPLPYTPMPSPVSQCLRTTLRTFVPAPVARPLPKMKRGQARLFLENEKGQARLFLAFAARVGPSRRVKQRAPPFRAVPPTFPGASALAGVPISRRASQRAAVCPRRSIAGINAKDLAIVAASVDAAATHFVTGDKRLLVEMRAAKSGLPQGLTPREMLAALL